MSAEAVRSRRLEAPALPVRFTATDAAADGQTRTIEIDRERVLVRRQVRGMAIRVSLPHQAYRGVSLRLGTEGCEVRLEHRDPGLSVNLETGADETDMFAQWEAWGRALSLPLMIGVVDGDCCEVGSIANAKPVARRRSHNAVKTRRPSILLRRKKGDKLRALRLYREREIIARS
ncbi:hypothetical protein GJW-30_1_00379 [Variibacter gotjawalensis]|uniref:Uncharacterized protein n=2 Tax=Variibacter gotjawalensis TaxID=1333996 RepID=A0A0S3PPP1_9BRAD|nr:hypothetical protein EV661_2488 [Variibacter gotjawalensis]BAT57869.1 hypothetical protein GJW-30_1_00379 [Variibacter gotjawalensis]